MQALRLQSSGVEGGTRFEEGDCNGDCWTSNEHECQGQSDGHGDWDWNLRDALRLCELLQAGLPIRLDFAASAKMLLASRLLRRPEDRAEAAALIARLQEPFGVRFRSRPLEQVMRASFFQIMASIRKGKIKTPTEQQPGKESSEETPLSPVAQKTETVTVPSKRQLEEALPSTGEQSPVADDASEEDADTQDIDCPSSEPSYVALLHQQQRHLPKVMSAACA
eukprot:1253275-Amphidinium_carterae.1